MSIKLSRLMLIILLLPLGVGAQNDLGRQTVAITYPLDQTVRVPFRGTTRLPRLKGEAKVKRSGRRNTRVELSIENMPRAFELGEPYTTYVLWAIAPDGRVDNLGEIKRSGSVIFDTKIDVTTPLQTFALIVTAEPHFLMRAPSRMVVLENLPPQNPKGAEVAAVDVKYIGNTSDYFDSGRVPEVAGRDYAKTPVSLLGARQAVQLARYAGAARDAENELQRAEEELNRAEAAYQARQNEAEVDALARSATSLGAQAEEISLARRTARERREERAQRDAEVREIERTAADASEELTRTKTLLEQARRDRELLERDLANANQQLSEQRTEISRLREELATERASGQEARVKLARIEGERQALEAQRAAQEQAQSQASTSSATQPAASSSTASTPTVNLRAELNRFGTVRDSSQGATLILPDSIFNGARSAQLSSNGTNIVTELASLLAANPDYVVTINAYADNRGNSNALLQLTAQRAQIITDLMTQAGVAAARIQAYGQGANNPVAPNTTLATRTRNRRVEITIAPRNVTAGR